MKILLLALAISTQEAEIKVSSGEHHNFRIVEENGVKKFYDGDYAEAYQQHRLDIKAQCKGPNGPSLSCTSEIVNSYTASGKFRGYSYCKTWETLSVEQLEALYPVIGGASEVARTKPVLSSRKFKSKGEIFKGDFLGELDCIRELYTEKKKTSKKPKKEFDLRKF
jgi:hypothetical protein